MNTHNEHIVVSILFDYAKLSCLFILMLTVKVLTDGLWLHQVFEIGLIYLDVPGQGLRMAWVETNKKAVLKFSANLIFKSTYKEEKKKIGGKKSYNGFFLVCVCFFGV